MTARAGKSEGAPLPSARRRWRLVRDGLSAPVTALRRTAHDPVMVRVQVAWAAVMTASWAVTVALTVAAYDAGGSAAVSVAVLARTLPGVLAGPVLGVLVDRLGRRRSLAWTALVCAVGSAAAAAAGSVLWAVVALLTVVALATMAFRTAQSIVLPELVDEPGDLTAANVLSSAIEALGVFVGPALAGLLIALRGPEAALTGAAVLFTAGALLSSRLGREDGAHLVAPTDAPPRLRQLAALGSVRLLLGLATAQTVVAGALVVLYAALAVEVLEADLGAVGLLTSCFGLGGVVGSVGLFALAGSSRLGALSTLALCLWGLPLVLVPLVPELGVVVGLLALVGVGNALFDVTVVTLLQRAVPAALLGRAFGVLETIIVVGMSVGALVAPVLERLAGPAGTVALLGGTLALTALAALPALRRLDAELAAPARQVELLRGLEPFALMPTFGLERLALRLRPLGLAPGEVAVRQGDPGDAYYLVDGGTLTVTVDGRDVAVLGPGEGFGEVALLHGGTRTATLTADGPVVLQALDGADFLTALTGTRGRGLAAAERVAQERLRRAAPAEGGA